MWCAWKWGRPSSSSQSGALPQDSQVPPPSIARWRTYLVRAGWEVRLLRLVLEARLRLPVVFAIKLSTSAHSSASVAGSGRFVGGSGGTVLVIGVSDMR